jgi:hypothetical protein
MSAREISDDPTVPGAMEVVITRELPTGGKVIFESAPAGWLLASGEVRRAHYRGYYLVADGPCPGCGGSGREPGAREGKTRKCSTCSGTGEPRRLRLLSVSSVLDSISPKPGIPPWAESKGIQGAVVAMRHGMISDGLTPLQAVQVVREARLGADAARDEAAERGINIHAIVEAYARTGSPPDRSEFPEAQRGYVQAAAGFLLMHRPEPVQIEELVCHAEAGYAGRSDQVAMLGPLRTRLDYKTSEKTAIYSSSHVQIGLYEAAAIACGDEPTDQQWIVALGADGTFQVSARLGGDALVEAALAYSKAIRPVDAFCASVSR